ncbi:hypothetical protein TNCT_659741 [Trichonephila clavata]|uniref:Uncharacterized protein n=1 Tax=Trichonephila clavata TaxID=2740835 RepID=A0A8X6LM66_TRICU|nr:hypothetical protein TNCT_659741 [Trichonephila clavata]
MEDKNKQIKWPPARGAENVAPKRWRPAERTNRGERMEEVQGRKAGGLRQQSKKRSGQVTAPPSPLV